MSRFRERYLGDRNFYAAVLRLILPIIVQQGVTQFVNLLDNVMVGALGTIAMSGVAIVNQLIFIFNLTIFGGLSGASIFGAQFAGKQDWAGLRYTLRFRLLFSLGILAVGVGVFLRFGEPLFRLYLPEGVSDPADIAATLAAAGDYLRIMLWGLLPFVLVQCFSGVLRDVGDTVTAMRASILAIAVNLVGNWLLIFGSLGLPKMGVAGAALATVLSRYVELAYLAGSLLRGRKRYPFLRGVFRSLRVPLALTGRILVTGTPLMLNEMLWSLGMAAINVCYASRGLGAVAAVNICTTVGQLFSIVTMSMGNAIGILIGQLLGAGELEEARRSVRKLIFFSVGAGLLVGALVVAVSPLLPLAYHTEPQVRATATRLLALYGCFMPVMAFANGSYFTIRSGGKTFITFLSDCVFTWVVCFPIAWVFANLTQLSVVWIYFFVQCAEILKALLGYFMLRSGIWVNNIVKESEETL